MKPLRIAMLSHSYPYVEGSHAGQFVHELASTLVKQGHSIYALIPTPSQDPPQTLDGVNLVYYRAHDKVSYGHADSQYVRKPRLSVALSLVSAIWTLNNLVRKEDMDLLHAHWAVPMGFVGSVVKSLRGTPLVITTHGRDIYNDQETGANISSLWFVRPFLRFALQKADGVVAVSQDCKRYAVQAGAASRKTKVIYNGVNTKAFSPGQDRKQEISQRLQIDLSATWILFVGTLAEYKGIDILIRSLRRLIDSGEQAIALIIGDGPDREALIELRDSLGLEDKVRFLGSIPNVDLPPYINSCDVFVLPSRRESFGIAAVEAMACAKPVVATRVGGLQEIIDDNQNGLIVEPENVDQLTHALRTIVMDKEYAMRLGENARRKAVETFDWANIAWKTQSLYKNAIRGDLS